MQHENARPEPLFRKVTVKEPFVINGETCKYSITQRYIDAEKIAAELFPKDLTGDAVKKIMQEEEAALIKQLLRVASEDGITDFIVLDTVEIKKILHKQVPYKPTIHKLIIGIGRCKCGVEFLNSDTEYCGNCGQRLDWSDLSENEEPEQKPISASDYEKLKAVHILYGDCFIAKDACGSCAVYCDKPTKKKENDFWSDDWGGMATQFELDCLSWEDNEPLHLTPVWLEEVTHDV